MSQEEGDKIELEEAEESSSSSSDSSSSDSSSSDSSSSDSSTTSSTSSSSSEQEEQEEQDPLHIGNLIGINSQANGYTKGRIVYRDLEMVRIMPDEVSDRAIEFPLAEEGTAFAPALGITGIEMYHRQTSPFYVDLLGARPGERLEFFTKDGDEAAESGIVADILRNETEGAEQDAIRLTDGRFFDFSGIGPPEPIAVIRVSTSMNAAVEAIKGEDEADAAAADIAAAREAKIAALLLSILPSAAVEIIPTAERTYPDSMQRDGLFQDLLAALGTKQTVRKIRAIEREVDLAVALKNKSIQRDTGDRIIGAAPYLITTVSDAVSRKSTPSAIPVVEAARVLNLDDARTESYEYKESDILPRSLGADEMTTEENTTRYLEGAQPDAVGGMNTFYAYNYDLLGRGLATLQGSVVGAGWSEDQDVIRTAAFELPVQGLSKRLPSAGDDEAPPLSLAYLVSDVEDRNVRVLGADRHIYRKTGASYVSAPSDPNRVTGYVILPPKAALKLRPPTRPGHLPTALLYSAALDADNLPTIAATLTALFSREAGSPQNAWTLAADAASEFQVAEWLQSVLRYTVHPIDSLGPRGPHLLSLLDTLGVGHTDLAPAVAEVVDNWVSESQKTWISLMKARRAEIQAALDTEEPRTFQSVVGVDSPLWAALRTSESLKELIEDIDRRNPSISAAPTLLTAALLVEAQGDATPLVWTEIAKLDSRELGGIDVVTASAALAASRAYTLRRAALRTKDLVALRSEPEVNTCRHVKRLESLRNVDDVLERSRLLRAFIEEFQGPKANDWITCVLCKKNCVCYHELMELEALAQPQRLDIIQKQMLIKFGGERYEGKIVCKNCGQALQDIDYDDHVEFDDDGRPIQQSSVLTAEQMEDEESAAASMIASSITFDSQSHREIAEALTDLLSHARVSMPPDVFRRIVNYADIYVGRRAPDETKYTATLKRKSQSASTKFKKTTGMSDVQVDLPTYAETVDQLRVSALMALVTIAIQTNKAAVSAALPRCPFNRGGFPLDASANPAGPGTLLYIACVAADTVTESKFKRKPWTSQLWVGKEAEKTRRNLALGVAYAALGVILGLDSKAAALSFTPEIRMEMTMAQTDKVAARERSLLSLKDELPVGFRPEPNPPAIAKPVIEGKIKDVGDAVHRLAVATIVDLHKEAATLHKDGMCCPVAVGKGFTVEFSPLRDAATAAAQLQRSAATTLWPVMETPMSEPISQAVEEGVFFKLFLKFCYHGPSVGNPHEFGVGNICRQCGLVLGTSIDLIDFGKEGAGILAAQQGPLRIEVTRVAFDALSDAARRRKIIGSAAANPLAVDKSGLPLLIATCNRMTPTAEFAGILAAILGSAGAGADELARATQWAPLSMYMEGLAAEAGVSMDMVDAMTEDPFIEGPRAVQEYLCAKAYAAGVAYGVTEVKGSRWFNISTEHNDIINGILSDNAKWYDGKITDAMKPVLRKIGQLLGPVVDIWLKAVRPDASRWTITEAQMVLRALVVIALHDALTSTSWMYEEIPLAAERAAILAGVRAWSTGLLDFKSGPRDVAHKKGHVQKQFIRYSKEEVRRILQQRAELERTSVVEEFESIKDDDLRAAELIKKQFRIGRWGVGKNLQKYDADLFEFENAQRIRMGVTDLQVAPDGVVAPIPEAVQQEAGYDMDQGAEGDNY